MRGLLLVLAAVGTACSAAGGSLSASTATSAPQATDRPTSHAPAPQNWTPDPSWAHSARSGMPSGTEPCRSQEAVEIVLLEFARAFNTADVGALEAVLSQEFWAVAVAGYYAYSREDAVTMIRERQRTGDRLEFRRVTVNGLVGWDGAAHIGPVEFALRRDGGASVIAGKGALYCGGRARGITVIGVGAQ